MSAQQTVLVVDDEEPLRRYIGRVMADEGYRVLLAEDGLEALGLGSLALGRSRSGAQEAVPAGRSQRDGPLSA
jgi:hypothetical protein